jgi:hypothetical protein
MTAHAHGSRTHRRIRYTFHIGAAMPSTCDRCGAKEVAMRKPASILFPTMTAVLFAVLCAAAGR